MPPWPGYRPVLIRHHTITERETSTMRRRRIARKAIKTAIIAKSVRQLARRAEKHLGKHK